MFDPSRGGKYPPRSPRWKPAGRPPSPRIPTIDAAGQQTSMTDANGNVTTYLCDNAGREISVTQPPVETGGPFAVTAYTYNQCRGPADIHDRRQRQRDNIVVRQRGAGNIRHAVPGGNRRAVRRHRVNLQSMPRASRHPWPTPTAMRQHICTTTRGGKYPSRSPRWKPAGRPPSPRIPTIDAAGRQTSMTDANGNVTTYLYDNAGRELSVTQPPVETGGPSTATA